MPVVSNTVLDSAGEPAVGCVVTAGATTVLLLVAPREMVVAGGDHSVVLTVPCNGTVGVRGRRRD